MSKSDRDWTFSSGGETAKGNDFDWKTKQPDGANSIVNSFESDKFNNLSNVWESNKQAVNKFFNDTDYRTEKLQNTNTLKFYEENEIRAMNVFATIGLGFGTIYARNRKMIPFLNKFPQKTVRNGCYLFMWLDLASELAFVFKTGPYYKFYELTQKDDSKKSI